MTGREAAKKLLYGEPPIAMPTRGDGLFVQPYQTVEGEEILVARRVKELLLSTVV